MISAQFASESQLQDPQPPQADPKFTSRLSRGQAPFLSTVQRRSKRNKPTLQSPGPGHYNVSKPIVAPIIDAFMKSENAIIVKFNDAGSAAFKGSEDRFKKNATLSPGPAYYNYQTTIQPKHPQKNILQSYKRKFRQLYDQKRIETIPPLKRQAKSRSEDIDLTRLFRNARGTSWSKYMTNRASGTLTALQCPGPGAYSPEQTDSTAKDIVSSFKSESLRTYLDTIVHQSLKNQQQRERYSKHKQKQQKKQPASRSPKMQQRMRGSPRKKIELSDNQQKSWRNYRSKFEVFQSQSYDKDRIPDNLRPIFDEVRKCRLQSQKRRNRLPQLGMLSIEINDDQTLKQ